MQINPEYLRRHYATLSDEALLAMDRDELVPLAQKCYDEEVARRGPLPRKDEDHWNSQRARVRPPGRMDDLEEPEGDSDLEIDGVDEPPWLAEAVCACAFSIHPANDSAADAGAAREVLEAAGIPCYLAIHELAPTPAQREYRLMVPSRFNLLATGVLDKEIFNADIEAEWRMHFEELPDDELRAVEPEVLFAGLLDRIERVKKAFEEELARGKLGPSRYNKSS